MSALKPLQDLVASGLQPKARHVWLGLGLKPAKRGGIEIEPNQLPTDADCTALAGLDITLVFNGFLTRYGTLRRLCGSIYQARPRRILLVDLDYRKTAFVKLGGSQ